jgi:hypothetical protein
MSHHHDSMGGTRRRKMTRTAGLSAFVMLALGFGGPMSASAQSSGAPTLDSQRPDVGAMPAPGGPLPAPVGHRQPRPQDLPPSVLRDEGAPAVPRDEKGTTGQGASDRSLTICRNC